MDGKIDIFTLLALVAAIVAILKLRSVLGRKTGDEENRVERARAERAQQQANGGPASSDKVVALPRREREGAGPEPTSSVPVAETEAKIRTMGGADQSMTRGLLEILKIDTTFDPEIFLRGARVAYEMIVTAFAEGNRKALRDLLSRDVYDGFVNAMNDREARGEQIDQSFVGINKADVLEADMKNGIASITVRFVSQLITATRDKAGVVIAGDAQRIKEVTDIWTFSRDLSSTRARQNPNWKLVATQASN